MKRVELFFWGVIMAFAAFFAEAVVYFLFFTPNFLDSYRFQNLNITVKFLLYSALIEEAFKNYILYQRIAISEEKFSASFSAAFLGLGFSLTETSFLYFKLGGEFFSHFPFIGGIIIIHIIIASLIGYFFATQKQRGGVVFITSVLLASIIHFAYNYFVYFLII